MASERNASRTTAVAERRPAALVPVPVAPVSRTTHATSTLQQRLGNRGTQALAVQVAQAPNPTPAPAPPQAAPAPPPPDPEAELTDDLANYMLQMPDVVDALELSKGAVKRLTKVTEQARTDDDDDLKQRLAALDKRQRTRVAAAAIGQVKSVLGARYAQRLVHLADEIALRTKDRLVALAKVARDAELEEVEQYRLDPKKKGRRRPQFPVIHKYILLDTVDRQIKNPRAAPYPLREDYLKPLDLAKDVVLFPDLHDENFVAELKGVPKSMRQLLITEVVKRTLETLKDYIQERMGTLPATIIAEWQNEFEKFDPLVQSSMEHGPKTYFAVRTEFLKLFGAPADVRATIKAINFYFKNVLVKCEFLQDTDIKGAGNTLVHPSLNAALKQAEKFMNDRKWRDTVIQSMKKYWATNIRENRNDAARPSEHTYGFAVDIDDTFNPNLAKIESADWDFISDIVGERVIYESGSTKKRRLYTPDAEALRSPSASTDPQVLEDAMKKIRSQSDTLAATFASDSSLRARLQQIVSASPAGKGKSSTEIDEVVEFARVAATGRGKDRQQAAKSLQATLQAHIFKQRPIASEPVGTPSKLRDKLVKLLAPNLRKLGKVTEAETAIRGQIVAPVDKATADAKKHKLGGLFARALVKELSTVAPADRAELARQVLRDLREPLERKDAETTARPLAALLTRGFKVLGQTKTSRGGRVGPGQGLPNIAVHGFSNLNEKLVVALVHPNGGNLKWLGVANQDMHHFQLRTLPTIPKATIQAPVPQPSPPPPLPAVAPQPAGLTNPSPGL